MPTATFYPSLDGYISGGSGSSWSSVHNKTNGAGSNISSTQALVDISSGTLTNYWDDIIRSVLMFDTSSLGSAIIINSATLSIKGLSKSNSFTSTNFGINVVSASPSSTSGLSTTDFDNFGTTTYSTAISYNSFSTSAYNNFALNASGLAAINKTGITKFGIRESVNDIPNVAPTWQAGKTVDFFFSTADTSGTSSDPKLVIDYSLPPPMSDLSDTFDDNSINTSLWETSSEQFGSATIAETNQRIQIDLASGSTNSAGLTSASYYDLTNDAAYIRVVQGPNQTNTSASATFLVQVNNNDQFYWRLNGGYLQAYRSLSTGTTLVANLTYDATTHLWWRIRQAASGTSLIYWDTSANNTTWTQRGSYTYSGAVTLTKAVVTAWTSSQTSPGSLYFDDFNNPIQSSSLSGTLLLSGSIARPSWQPHESVSGTLLLSGSVGAFLVTDTSIIQKKIFIHKVYDENNNFLGVWDDVIGEPEWSQEINTTGSAITVTLARNSDSLVQSIEALQDNASSAILDNNSYEILTSVESRNKVGPGSDVNHNYRVDIFAYYGEVVTIDDNFGLPIEDNAGNQIQGTIGAPNGVRRFTGFISEININYGNTENTQVQLMSYGFDLDQYPVVNASAETTVAFNSYDPGNIVREGLTQFTTSGAGETFTTYTTATVELTGTSTSYTFRVNTYKELLETAIKLAPEGWFFYVGLGDNLVRFRAKPTTPEHTFYLGKHIKNLNLRSYIGDTVNDVIFSGGGDPALFKRYTSTPATGTRRGLDRLSDNRVILEASADILSEGEIDERNLIQYRSTVEILDKTYDIESIELGDLVNFRNFDNNVDLISMQVVGLNYTPDVITLALDTLAPTVPKRLEELRKALNAQETETVPVEPDV